MADSQPKLERPKRDPQALSPEYHKARKQLVLWAGVLFAWELIGIDLEKAKETGGNAGAVITAIKSPQAVPWVLVVLVAYFLFKLWVEWSQCAASRRDILHARIDYGSAWSIAVLACSLYVYQALGRIQLADLLLHSSPARSLVLGPVFGMFIGLVVTNAIQNYHSPELSRARRIRKLITAGGQFVVIVYFLSPLLSGGFVIVKFTALGLFIGLTVWVLVFRKLKARTRGKPTSQAQSEERD